MSGFGPSTQQNIENQKTNNESVTNIGQKKTRSKRNKSHIANIKTFIYSVDHFCRYLCFFSL